MMRWLFDMFSPARPPIVSGATARDVADIATLHAKSFRRGWSDGEIEGLLLDRGVVAHRATIGRNFAGFVMSRIALDEAEILSVAVAPAYRGRSVARSLLRHHLGTLAAHGVRTVFLEVDEGNEPALKLYRRGGFMEVGRREAYYLGADGKPAAALVLRRELV